MLNEPQQFIRAVIVIGSIILGAILIGAHFLIN